MGRIFISDNDAPDFFGEDFRGVQSGSSSKPIDQWASRPGPFPSNLLGMTNADMARQGEADTLASEALPAQAKGGLVGGAIGLTGALAGPAIASAAVQAIPRAAGAAEGYRMGAKGSRMAGLPGAAGGIPGAIAGAILPGAVGGAGIAEQVGSHFGGEGGGLTGLAAAILLKKYGGPALGKILAGRFGAQIINEGLQAAKAAHGTEQAATVMKGANPEAIASIAKVLEEAGASPATARAVAASEAARGAASGAEEALQGLPGVIRAAEQTTVASKGPAQQIIAFAKDVAKRNPKVGEKIWMELGADGAPTRYLTPDQAAAAKRAGKATTWAKNLWAN